MVVFHVLNFEGFRKKAWAFRQLGIGSRQLAQEEGLKFVKLMGTGSGNGLNWYPDFSRYAILSIWQDSQSAEAFCSKNAYLMQFKAMASSFRTFWLHTFQAKGAWDGENPFAVTQPGEEVGNKPVAILTRASIRPFKAYSFWQNVPAVSKQLGTQPGCQFSVGIGEFPIFRQATFSVWENLEQVKAFAYRNQHHADVIKKTKSLNWYSEELFARFLLVRSD